MASRWSPWARVVVPLLFFVLPLSHPQRLHSFWSAPRSATFGKVRFFWACAENLFHAQTIRLDWDSEHAQSNGKSVNHKLSVSDRFLALTKRSSASGHKNGFALVVLPCPLLPSSWFMVGLCSVKYTYPPLRISVWRIKVQKPGRGDPWEVAVFTPRYLHFAYIHLFIASFTAPSTYLPFEYCFLTSQCTFG